MKTMNMPGFSAEDSLYISRTQDNMTASRYYQNHHLNTALLVQRNVVPQLPIFLGKVCGDCLPAGPGAIMGIGGMKCCDFYCDMPKGKCWKQGCVSDPCRLLVPIGGGGGFHTGGGGFDTGGGVFTQ